MSGASNGGIVLLLAHPLWQYALVLLALVFIGLTLYWLETD